MLFSSWVFGGAIPGVSILKTAQVLGNFRKEPLLQPCDAILVIFSLIFFVYVLYLVTVKDIKR